MSLAPEITWPVSIFDLGEKSHSICMYVCMYACMYGLGRKWQGKYIECFNWRVYMVLASELLYTHVRYYVRMYYEPKNNVSTRIHLQYLTKNICTRRRWGYYN